MGFFNKAKEAYGKFTRDRSEEWNKRQAEKLQRLKTKRVEAEGKARLLKLESKEQAKLDKAKGYAKEQRLKAFSNAKKSFKGLLSGARTNANKINNRANMSAYGFDKKRLDAALFGTKERPKKARAKSRPTVIKVYR